MAADVVGRPVFPLMLTPAELKQALKDAGLEIYRTRGHIVHLAERVRENLIMDSCVFVDAELKVGFVVRAQQNDFPYDSQENLFERARDLASVARQRGYEEREAAARPVLDPGDPNRTLDTFCEVVFERSTTELRSALDEVRFAMSLERTVVP